MPAISVVIPIFNSEKTILRTIQSAVAQSYSVHEIIVVDDGSTDDSVSLIQSHYAGKVNILRLPQNAGPGAARNAGVNAAVGDWIAFLDADDEWLSDKLRRQTAILQKHPDLVWCGSNYHVEKAGVSVPKLNADKCRAALGNADFFEHYFEAACRQVCSIQTSTILMRKDVFKAIGGFDPTLLRHQDWDLWWKIAHRHTAIGFDAQPQVIHHLAYDNPVINARRMEAKKGLWLSALIQRHLVMAKQAGTESAFVPLAHTHIRNSILSMLFIGFTAEAIQMMATFRTLLSRRERLFFKMLLWTAPASLPLLRTAVWLLERTGVVKFPYRNWDYRKAYRRTRQRSG